MSSHGRLALALVLAVVLLAAGVTAVVLTGDEQVAAVREASGAGAAPTAALSIPERRTGPPAGAAASAPLGAEHPGRIPALRTGPSGAR